MMSRTRPHTTSQQSRHAKRLWAVLRAGTFQHVMCPELLNSGGMPEARWLSALGRRAAQSWSLTSDSQRSAEWWSKPTAVIRSWPELWGSSFKHVSKTPGIMKRSWPEATPVALEPWHYEESQWASHARPGLQVASPLPFHSHACI